MEKFAIRDGDTRSYLWGMTRRSGYGFEDEEMPQFWALNDKTKLFDSEDEAKKFAERRGLGMWSQYRIVPITVTYAEP